jgi:hypothetical protein
LPLLWHELGYPARSSRKNPLALTAATAPCDARWRISWRLSRSISRRRASSILQQEAANCYSRSNENEGLSDKVTNIKGKTLQRKFICYPSMSFISPR